MITLIQIISFGRVLVSVVCFKTLEKCFDCMTFIKI